MPFNGIFIGGLSVVDKIDFIIWFSKGIENRLVSFFSRALLMKLAQKKNSS